MQQMLMIELGRIRIWLNNRDYWLVMKEQATMRQALIVPTQASVPHPTLSPSFGCDIEPTNGDKNALKRCTNNIFGCFGGSISRTVEFQLFSKSTGTVPHCKIVNQGKVDFWVV
jgi:hypothetical protein